MAMMNGTSSIFGHPSLKPKEIQSIEREYTHDYNYIRGDISAFDTPEIYFTLNYKNESKVFTGQCSYFLSSGDMPVIGHRINPTSVRYDKFAALIRGDMFITYKQDNTTCCIDRLVPYE